MDKEFREGFGKFNHEDENFNFARRNYAQPGDAQFHNWQQY